MATTRGGSPETRGPISRSMSRELVLGQHEGAYRSSTPNRGGLSIDPATNHRRSTLHYDQYGNHGHGLGDLTGHPSPDAVEFIPRF